MKLNQIDIEYIEELAFRTSARCQSCRYLFDGRSATEYATKKGLRTDRCCPSCEMSIAMLPVGAAVGSLEWPCAIMWGPGRPTTVEPL